MLKKVKFIALLGIFFFIKFGITPQYLKASESKFIDTTPRLVVMSAFDAEMKNLIKQANITDKYLINGKTYHVGTLAENKVVLVLSGISMINAAMTTQTIIDHFNIKGIIFSGIAGGVNPNLHIGDVTIPAQWAQYQEQLFAQETALGKWNTNAPVALIKPLTNFGMMFPKYVSIVTEQNGGTPTEENKLWFPVNTKMLSVVRKVIETKNTSKILANCLPNKKCLQNMPKIIIGGNGVSSQTFVNNKNYREWVWNTFKADALDMETASVAHVAYVNRVPYIAFRSLSDLAGGGADENELSAFFQLAANNSSSLLLEFLQEWAKQ